MVDSYTHLMEETARRFLRNVMVFDDRITWGEGRATLREPHGNIRSPGRGSASTTKPAPTVENGDQSTGDSAHRIDVIPIINEFANHGIVCGLINPLDIPEPSRMESIRKVSTSADIIIVDWKVDGEHGKLAIPLIRELLNADSDSDIRPTRLIIIYTGDNVPDVDQIFAENDDLGLLREEAGMYRKDGTRILVWRKPDVSFNALCAKAITEFAQINRGLLCRAAMVGLTAIQENTHRILARFGPEMDAPYLAHRAMTNPTVEAEHHVGLWLGSDLQDLVSGAFTHEHLTMDTIKTWIRTLPFRKKQQYLKALEIGVEELRKRPDQPNKKFHKEHIKPVLDTSDPHKLTELVAEDGKEAKTLDRKLAIHTTLRFPPSTRPSVSLGTIVRSEHKNNKGYWVCVTPACDCVRLRDTGDDLLFIPLEQSNPKKTPPFYKKPFSIVVEYKNKCVLLSPKLKIKSSKFFRFKPDEQSKTVIATNDGGHWIFHCHIPEAEIAAQTPSPTRPPETTDLIWLGDLKPAHAQRIAQRFTAQMGRVGVTEADWLRRLSDL